MNSRLETSSSIKISAFITTGQLVDQLLSSAPIQKLAGHSTPQQKLDTYDIRPEAICQT